MDISIPDFLTAIIFLFTIYHQPAVAFCPVGCVCTDDSLLSPSVECDNIGLTSIPILLNPRIRSLSLSDNRISTISLDDLGFYTELEFLDLSNNKILTIERGSFYRLQKLKRLRLNGNLLASISIETFTGLSELRHLDLSENGFGRFGASVFSDLRKLEILNVSGNSINHYSPGSLTGLSSLRQFYTQYNELTSIPSIALRSLPFLRILDLSHNRIERIEDDSFPGLKELESLILADNIITTIEDRAFNGLRALRHLNLDSTRLHRIPTISFRPLTDLRSLSLNDNHFFTEVPTSAFEGLPLLRLLSISRCSQLRRIQLNAFSGLSNLATLFMFENRALSLIDSLAFEYGSDDDPSSSYSPLRHLSIHGNNLSTLPKSLLPWSRLEELDLRWNPWHCDCQFGPWIGKVLRLIYSEGPYPEGATCVEPDHLRLRPLQYLKSTSSEEDGDPSDFDDCQSSATSIAVNIAITIVAVVACVSLIITVIICLGYRRKLPCYGCCATTSFYNSVSPLRCRYSAPPGLPELSRYTIAVDQASYYQHDDQHPVRQLLTERRKEVDCDRFGTNGYPGQKGTALYEEPDNHYASCGTSGYYSCIVTEHGPTKMNGVNSRDSFRILQQYPVPVTEL